LQRSHKNNYWNATLLCWTSEINFGSRHFLIHVWFWGSVNLPLGSSTNPRTQNCCENPQSELPKRDPPCFHEISSPKIFRFHIPIVNPLCVQEPKKFGDDFFSSKQWNSPQGGSLSRFFTTFLSAWLCCTAWTIIM